MAKIRSHLFTEAHGSVGGLTFQGGNSCTAILRSKPIPIRAKSSRQCINQSIFTKSLSYINSLSQRNIDSLDSQRGSLSFHSAALRILIPLNLYQYHSGTSLSNIVIPSNCFSLAPSIFRCLPPAPGNSGFRIQLFYPENIRTHNFFWLSHPQSISSNRFYKQFQSSSFSIVTITSDFLKTIEFYGLKPDHVYFVKLKPFRQRTNPYTGIQDIAVGKPLYLRCVSRSL